MTDAGVSLDFIGLMLTGGCIVATAVWGVGKITSKLSELTERVDWLSKSITHLADQHETTTTRVADLTERVVKLEAKR